MTCKLCDGTGKIPLRRKSDNSIVPYAWTFCDSCYSEGNPYPYQYTPDMYDFPMSYSFYRSLCREHGWIDPGSDYPPESQEEAPKEQVVIHRHSDMSKQDYDMLQQTARQMKFLQAKVDELTAKRKPKSAKPKPITTGKPAFRGTV